MEQNLNLKSLGKAAKDIGVTRTTVYRWADAELIAVVKIGDMMFTPQSEIDRIKAELSERPGVPPTKPTERPSLRLINFSNEVLGMETGETLRLIQHLEANDWMVGKPTITKVEFTVPHAPVGVRNVPEMAKWCQNRLAELGFNPLDFDLLQEKTDNDD